MSNATTDLVADVPISDPSQDRLERASFAQSIARSIARLQGDDSFVIALCGAWGSGKTSVLNMALKEMSAAEDATRPIVCHFNPWWFSGRQQLLESFLAQFAAALELSDNAGEARKAAGLLKGFAKILRPLSFVPGISEAAKAGADFVSTVGDATAALADTIKSDVFKARQHIDQALATLDRRIVVVMDDIDRLAANEIAEVFLILKAVADFPKTVYVLAFDHRVVRKAIRHKLGVNGKTYLEKIVQLQLEVPSAGHTAVQNMFLDEAGHLCAAFSPKEIVDLGNTFHDGVKQFLTTPRAGKKLLNTLRFAYPPLRGEVYFPDMLGVACLFTFVPSAVQAITNDTASFVGVGRHHEDRKDLRAYHEEWLNRVDNTSRPLVTRIVRRLFPKVRWAFDGPGYSDDFEAVWQRELRVCSSAHIDKYFLLALPTGALTEAEWTEITDSIGAGDGFEHRLLAMSKEKGRGRTSRVKEVLDRLPDFGEVCEDQDRLATVCSVLFRVGDELIQAGDEEMVGGLIPHNNKDRLKGALWALLRALNDERRRAAIMRTAISSEYGLFIVCELVDLLAYQHGLFEPLPERDRQESPLLPQATVRTLANALRRRIGRAAKGNAASQLIRHPFWLRIVRHWQTFGAKKAAIQWCRRQAQRDEALVDALRQASSKTTRHGGDDYVAEVGLTVQTKYLGLFLDLKRTKARCARLLAEPPSWLTEEQLTLLKIADSLISADGQPLTQDDLRRQRFMPKSDDDLTASQDGSSKAQGEGQ